MSWEEFFNKQKELAYYQKLVNDLDRLYSESVVYPKRKDIFKALEYTDYEDVKVVIIGQDPYHNENQACGLAFSVNDDVKMPPSLRNILLELKNDLNIDRVSSDLSGWAKQGVLLLNKILTVKAHAAASHKDLGWDIFTDEIIKELNNKDSVIIFVLWGAFAQKLKRLISNPNHYIIESAHPSPLSAYRGFFGSKPFSKINEILKSHNLEEIDWSL